MPNSIDDTMSKGINFKNRRNWEKDEKVEEPRPVVKPRKDIEQLTRQQGLTKKYNQSKVINASGFAINGGSIWFIIFGMYNFFNSPDVQNHVELLNSLGINIDLTAIQETIEVWKNHLIALIGSFQGFLMWYQGLCRKMKETDTESLYEAINNELGEML